MEDIEIIINDKKNIKRGIILASFKSELESSEIEIAFQEFTLFVGTTSDKNAYQDVWFSLLNDSDKAWIKDRRGNFFELTKSGIHLVISKIVDAGKKLWAKKEKLLQEIEKATTIQEIEKIEW